MNYLFDLEPEADGEDLQDVRDIINEYDFLSKTKENSGVWTEMVCTMQRIVAGTFFCRTDLDRHWIEKILGNYDTSVMKFTWCELIKRTRDILNYIRERKPYGFWYPRQDKISLRDFYISTMKSGKCWSPFYELNFRDCATPQMYRKMFGPLICEKLDGILDNVWFSVDFDTKIRFYKGVDDFHNWYCDLPDEFINCCDENRLVFGKFSSLLENIRQCNNDTGCIYPSFIGPRSPKWSVLIDWLKKNKRIKFDLGEAI